jgi:hypothetical protein
MTQTADTHHATAIREVIEHWALDRDEEQWAPLLDAFSDDGQMVTSWSTLPARDFVAACEKGMHQRHYQVLHEFGASRVEVAGERALAATKMKIMLRGALDDVEVDVSAYGVSRDRFVLTPRGWKIALRRTVYQKSRIDPVLPDATLTLDTSTLNRYPAGYRHLAYFQLAYGAKVPLDLLTLDSDRLPTLVADDHAWLANERDAQ